MYVDIQARDFTLTGSIVKEVEKSISAPLADRYDKIGEISIRLADINGPKGGNDKACRVRIRIPGERDVFIEDVRSDLYAAISHAGDRAVRAVARKIQKRGEHRSARVYRNRNWHDLINAQQAQL